MTKTRKICYLAVLTALYVVLSAFLKINFIGNIQLDLGYLAFAVALCFFGPAGAVVGALGCGLESLLFSAYGFSISWVVANTIIGLGCGLCFTKTKKTWLKIIFTVIFAAIGLLGAKTLIECYLYSIPLLVKLPKNIVAFVTDTIVMVFGIFFGNIFKNRYKK